MAVSVVSFSFSMAAQPEPLRPGVGFPTTSRLQLARELNCSLARRTQLSSFSPVCLLFNSSAILPSNSHAVIMDTPPRLRNFFRYLATGMCHFRYFWNGWCDSHRAEIIVMQFRGHSLPVRQSMRV